MLGRTSDRSFFGGSVLTFLFVETEWSAMASPQNDHDPESHSGSSARQTSTRIDILCASFTSLALIALLIKFCLM
jgi:hypothetical protein